MQLKERRTREDVTRLKSDLFRNRLVFVNVFFPPSFTLTRRQTAPSPSRHSLCPPRVDTEPGATLPHGQAAHREARRNRKYHTLGKIKARHFYLLPGEIQTFHQPFIYVYYYLKGNTLVKIDTIFIFLIGLLLPLNQNDALQFGY